MNHRRSLLVLGGIFVASAVLAAASGVRVNPSTTGGSLRASFSARTLDTFRFTYQSLSLRHNPRSSSSCSR